MYEIFLLIIGIFLIFVFLKLRNKNKKATPKFKNNFLKDKVLSGSMLSKEIDKIKCKEIIRK
ncbi:hypothetical protein SAMN04487886_100634 [Clostridium sp. DSM 8431]|nr:hypothetical protein SAMN04487886_100634 [Clostridium sp. DSM 8431]